MQRECRCLATLAAALILDLAACVGHRANDDRAKPGVTVVEVPSTPHARVDETRLARVATLGNGTAPFEDPASVVIAGEHIFVLDVAGPRLRVFDRQGAELGQIDARAGSRDWGPRFGNATRCGRGFAVLDLSHKQIVMVDADRSVRELPAASIPGAAAYALACDDQGRPVIASRILSPNVDQPVGTTVFARLDAASWTPFLTLPPAANPPMTISLGGARPLWAFGPDGTLATSTEAGCGLEIRDATDSVRRVLQQVRPPLPVSAADQDLIRQRFEARLKASAGSNAGPLLDAARMVRVPVEYPAYVRLLSDDLHRFWLQRPVGAQALVGTRAAQLDALDFGSEHWDVWDAQGRNLFEVTFPTPFELRAVAGNLVAGVSRDTTGRAVVALYRFTSQSGDL